MRDLVHRVVHVEVAGVPQCRDALARHVVQVLQHPFLQFIGIRHQPVTHVGRQDELLEPAGGLSGLVAHEIRQVLAEIRGVPVDAQDPEHRGIDPEAVPRVVVQQNGSYAGNLIQVSSVGAVRQVGGDVPRRLCDHDSERVIVGVLLQPGQRGFPRPGWHPVGCGGLFVLSSGFIQSRQVGPDADQAGVGVRVDYARHHESALQVYELGVRTSVPQGVLVRAHEDDSVVPGDQRLGPGQILVLGMDSAIHVHRFGCGGLLGRCVRLQSCASGCHRDTTQHEHQVSDSHHVSRWHCHVNRVGPQRPAWIPFQAAALALSHTLNAPFRNRLNVSLLHK